MKRSLVACASWIVAAALVLALGCRDDEPAAPHQPQLPDAQAVPDFSLTDVNPNSATHDLAVSPRQHLGRISAWYFGHAT